MFREKDISLQLFGTESNSFQFILFDSLQICFSTSLTNCVFVFLAFLEAETLEAIAQFDFTARSQREFSFKKGDLLTLYPQVSSNWWKGTKDGRDGLAPDK